MANEFYVQLTCTEDVAGLHACDRDVHDGDSIIDVMSAACRCLSNSGRVTFDVGGFGQPKWPVDVAVDLAVVAEQVPRVLLGLMCRDRNVELDFYEQGIQRLLSFEPVEDDRIRVTCRSGSDGWTPDPDEYVSSVSDLVRMLNDFARKFEKIVSELCPSIAYNASFREWSNLVGRADG